ncbi:MAG: hypothetical protein ABSH46_01680 [Bryobacteraceae bacterium]|jgi:hypothetical protein
MDLLFSTDVKTYMTKLTLRFGDTCAQLVVFTYPVWPVRPGGSAELVRYSLPGGCGAFTELVEQMLAQNPKVTDEEIAAKAKVEVTRSPIDPEAFYRVRDRLKAVRISPVLHSFVSCDGGAEHEYLYDTSGESVHYVISSPPLRKTPEDNLARWMDVFRANLPKLLARPSPPKPSEVATSR